MPSAADVWREQSEKYAREPRVPEIERVRDQRARDPSVPPAPAPLDPEQAETHAATMSHASLIRRVSAEPETVGEVVRVRPTMVGELIQMSLHSGNAGAAQALMSALAAQYRSGSAIERELLFRSVLRTSGPGGTVARDVLREVVRDEASHLKPMPGGAPLKDPRLASLDAAERDPETAKFRANFFDRPDATANQLLDEARRDPKAFRKHADALVDLIARSPEAAKSVAASVMRLRGPKAREVNLLLLGKAYHAMDHDMLEMEHGELGKRDVPARRAERIAPLLAQLASYPDNARELVSMSRLGETIGDTGVGLPGVLSRALDERWSFSIRDAVQHHINEGAADLFYDSLEPGREHRRAEAMDAARFMGEAACAEKHNLKSTTKEVIGQRLAQVGPRIVAKIPGASSVPYLDKAVGYGAEKLGEASKPVPKWTGKSTAELMQQIFKIVKHPPSNEMGTPERRAWQHDFTEWTSDGANELDLAAKECGE